MKNFYKIIAGIGIFALVLVAVAYMLPGTASTQRSIIIKVPREAVFNEINELKYWGDWSPWHKIDTTMDIVYSTPSSGKYAYYAWDSKNSNLGKGKLTLVNSSIDSIGTELYFMGENNPAYGSFYLKEVAEGTEVTWTFFSELGMNPMHRWMGLIMDKLIGNDYEKGLNSLKEVLETNISQVTTKIEVIETKIAYTPFLSIRLKCSETDIPKNIGECFEKISACIDHCGIKQVASPFVIYHGHGKIYDMECAIPTNKPATEIMDGIKAGELKASKVLKASFYGDYALTSQAHEAIDAYAKVNNKTITGAPWEVYITDPMEEKDTTKWLSEIYYPVQ